MGAGLQPNGLGHAHRYRAPVTTVGGARGLLVQEEELLLLLLLLLEQPLLLHHRKDVEAAPCPRASRGNRTVTAAAATAHGNYGVAAAATAAYTHRCRSSSR